MKILLGITLASVLTVTAQLTESGFQSGFAPGEFPLIDTSFAVNGTWHNDIRQGAHSQEVGGFGLATASGIAYSEVFGPVDVLKGNTAVSVDLYAISHGSTTPWRLTLYDASGGSAYWDITPLQTIPALTHYQMESTAFVGNLDWTDINRFSLSGQGGEAPFHATFDSLNVPEPTETALLVTLLLLSFALLRKNWMQPA